LAYEPIDDSFESLMIYVNGQLQTPGENFNRSESGLNKSEVPSGAINGTNTIFTLGGSVSGTVKVFVDGVRLNPTDFSVSGRTLTVNIAPTTTIQVDYTTDGKSVIFTSGSIPQEGQEVRAFYRYVAVDTLTGYIPVYNEIPAGDVDGINNIFVLAEIPYSNSLRLFVNGQLQVVGLNYTISDNVIAFVDAPISGQKVRAYYRFSDITSSILRADNETPSGIVDGANYVFTLTYTPTTGSLSLYVNGKMQFLGVDYNLSGNVINFLNIPLAGQYVRAWYEYTS
jgi:hypothetical protein